MKSAVHPLFIVLILMTPARSADLVGDINLKPNNASSYPRNFRVVGSTLFFTAGDSIHGRELWKCDGTAGGTSMVKDIRPGGFGSKSSYFTEVDLDRASMGGLLYFAADDGEHGLVLWRSDGTAAGTSVVNNVPPELGAASPYDLTVAGGLLYFTAEDVTHGRELWKSDGTAVGTVMVRDIVAGSGSVFPEKLTALGSTLIFRAGANPGKLWKSNGTDAGTVPIAASASRPDSSIYPQELVAMGGVLYYVGEDLYGPDLWRTDGTEAGTRMVRENTLFRRLSPSALTVAGNRLYFRGLLDDDMVGYGLELWKSDGTAAGTARVKDINPGWDSGGGTYLTQVGNTLFFFADDGVHGNELWRSGGTSATTVMVKDLQPGIRSTQAVATVASNGLLYFFATTAGDKKALWRSDGTAAGTMIVKEIIVGYDPSASFQLTAMGNKVFFSWNDGIHGEELWISDGTEAGTILVDINNGNADASPINLLASGDKLFFTANESYSSMGLWESDGSGTGTLPITQISKGNGPIPIQIVSAGNGMVFYNSSNAAGPQLWSTVGTVGGASALGNSTTDFYLPANLTIAGNTLFFSAVGQDAGTELYRSDGTPAGTRLVKDILAGPASSNPTGLTAVDGALFFTCEDLNSLSSLWKSDGTEDGTLMVKFLNVTGSKLGNFTSSNGLLYFTREDANSVMELWRSDGTQGGTLLITTIHPANSSVVISNLTDWHGVMFFTTFDAGLSQGELWRCDGTAAGTQRLKTMPECYHSAALHSLTPADGLLFFGYEGRFGFNGAGFGHLGAGYGYALWRTNGTQEGTFAAREFAAINPLGGPSSLVAAGGTVYFNGYDREHGLELWRSDGTSSGTRMVADLTGDSGSSSPRNLLIAGDKLFFSATTQASGRELWSIPLAPLGLIVTGNGDLIQNGSSVPRITDFTDFGGVGAGGNSVKREFRISNTGAVGLTGGNVTVAGIAAADFAIVNQPASLVAAGGSTGFAVTFSPSAPGVRNAVLSFGYGPPGGSLFTFAVSGGVEAGSIRAQWRQGYFGTADDLGSAADAADPDHDNIPNLLEWAFLLNPTASSKLPVTIVSQGTSFIYTAGQSVEALDAGTTFSLEWSDRMEEKSWSNAGVTQETLSEDETVRMVRHVGPMDAGGRRFFRMRVVAP